MGNMSGLGTYNKLLVKLVILVMYRYTNAVDIPFVSHTGNCNLWKPPGLEYVEFGANVRKYNLPNFTEEAKTGIFVTNTKWIIFRGCFHTKTPPEPFNISAQDDIVLKCYEHCQETSFSLYRTVCYCGNATNVSTGLCKAKNCSEKYTGLCGEDEIVDNTARCLCQYEPILIEKVSEGQGLCLSLSRKSQKNSLRPENCSARHNSFGISYPKQRDIDVLDIKRTAWWMAAQERQEKRKIFGNISNLEKIGLADNEYYWVGIFRKRMMIMNLKKSRPHHCVTVRKLRDFLLRYQISNCSSVSQALCTKDENTFTTGNGSVVSKSSTTTQYQVRRLTSETSSNGFWNTTYFASTRDPPTSTDSTESSNTTIYVIISLIAFSVMFVFITLFIWKYRKGKSPSSPANLSKELVQASGNNSATSHSVHDKNSAANANLSSICEKNMENEYCEMDIDNGNNGGERREDSAYDDLDKGNNLSRTNYGQNQDKYDHVKIISDGHYDEFDKPNNKSSAAKSTLPGENMYDHSANVLPEGHYDELNKTSRLNRATIYTVVDDSDYDHVHHPGNEI